MSGPNLEELLSNRQPRLVTAVAAARRAERVRRNNSAWGMAITALRRLHLDDFNALLEQATTRVNAERGPLPGDEVAS